MVIDDARTDVKDALTAGGLKALDYVAETITPPCAIVVPGSPYVTRPEGQVPFGTYEMTLAVLLLAGTGTNQRNAKALDEMVTKAVLALDDWDVDEVAQPGQVALNGSNFLGTVLTITTDIQIKE